MSDTPKHILEDAAFRASIDDVLSHRPKDGPFLRMAVEGMTSYHPDNDGTGYQCNRNMLLQDVYDTCKKILQDHVGGTTALSDTLLRLLADHEDVPFDLLWAVWVRMNEKA
jgi:hypothetical protein